jgi:hypothetical protein
MVVWNQECVLQTKGLGMMLPTPEDIIGFKSSTFDVGKNNSGRSRVD